MSNVLPRQMLRLPILKRYARETYSKMVGDLRHIKCLMHLPSGSSMYAYSVSSGSSSSLRLFPCQSMYVQHRFKSKKSHRANAGDESEESEDEEEEKSKDFQVLKGHANSTRIDAVLKFGLGMSRNKVDNAFYSSSIYLNGEKLLKKSHSLTVDDEVDVVRSENALNTSFLDVSRVQILDIHRSRSDPDKLTLKLRRFKQLTVENYSSPWKPIAAE